MNVRIGKSQIASYGTAKKYSKRGYNTFSAVLQDNPKLLNKRIKWELNLPFCLERKAGCLRGVFLKIELRSGEFSTWRR